MTNPLNPLSWHTRMSILKQDERINLYLSSCYTGINNRTCHPSCIECAMYLRVRGLIDEGNKVQRVNSTQRRWSRQTTLTTQQCTKPQQLRNTAWHTDTPTTRPHTNRSTESICGAINVTYGDWKCGTGLATSRKYSPSYSPSQWRSQKFVMDGILAPFLSPFSPLSPVPFSLQLPSLPLEVGLLKSS